MLFIRNLSHTYPNRVKALQNINLEIPKGMFGLLGPNGAGKSSLMRTLATLQQPTSGEIRFDDIDVLKQPEKLRRVLGYLPQEFGVYPRGSAHSILNHIAVLKGMGNPAERKKVVDAALELTNLTEVRNKTLATFSGGMHQRFGIAQALIASPRMLIVDEPTAGLDPEERNRFYNLLSKISEDVVVILSTHIVDDVAVLCPNMAIIARGQVVAQGATAELVSSIREKIWQKVISISELETYKARYNVISSHYVEGDLAVRINATAAPGNDFVQAAANLEDFYFSSIYEAPDYKIAV